eukprot:COSAG05_NODE_520_length_9047_cov_2.500224_13_plen_68_part_01
MIEIYLHIVARMGGLSYQGWSQDGCQSGSKQRAGCRYRLSVAKDIVVLAGQHPLQQRKLYVTADAVRA